MADGGDDDDDDDDGDDDDDELCKVLYVALSGLNSARIVIPQENNSPLTFYI